MTDSESEIQEIEQVDLEIDDYFRKDRAGDTPPRPAYESFIGRMRVQWVPVLDSTMLHDQGIASNVLDKLLTYERIWDSQFMRYAEECEHERKRQGFLDKASRAVDLVCKKTGKSIDARVVETLGSQYDAVIRSGKKPGVYYNKVDHTFHVKAKAWNPD